MTFGGGNGVLGADQCESVGLTVPPLAARDAGEAQAAARLDGDRFKSARSHADDCVPRRSRWRNFPPRSTCSPRSDDIDALLLIVSSLAPKAVEISQIMSDFSARSEKPVSVCWPATPAGAIGRLARRGIHCAIEPARSANATSRLLRHHAARNRPARFGANAPRPFDWAAHVPVASDYPQVISRTAAIDC